MRITHAPLEGLIDALVQIYEQGYSFVNIDIRNNNEDDEDDDSDGYTISMVGVGEKAEMNDEDGTPDELLDLDNQEN